MTVAVAVLLASPSVAHAQASPDFFAQLVLGQGVFTSNTMNFGGLAATFNPSAVAVDSSGHVYLADTGNSRVLGWKSIVGLQNDAPADLVIGQADAFSSLCFGPAAASLCFPQGLATDQRGDLYVSDSGHNRVVEYTQPFSSGLSAGQPANLVFGQSGSFTEGDPHFHGDGFNNPEGIALDPAGNLYVVDSYNGRVLEYNTPLTQTSLPGSGNTSLDLVFQDTFTPSDGVGIAVDGAGNVYVAEGQHVLEYYTPLMRTAVPGSGDTIADVILGQNPGSSDPCAQFRANTFCSPSYLALDPVGNLYVSDSRRVLEFDAPIRKTSAPSMVFGQNGSFQSGVCSDGLNGDPPPSARGLCYPLGVAADSVGDLLIADEVNSRLLEYNTPLRRTRVRGSGDNVADLVLGQPDFAHNLPNSGGPHALNEPQSVVIDAAGHAYIADTVNNRVLGFSNESELTSGAPADIVIGQTDFYSDACATSRAGLCLSYQSFASASDALAVDRVGNLYVVDGINNRVLEYNQPFNYKPSNGAGTKFGQPANLVFGQNGSFSANKCNLGSDQPSAGSLCGPFGVAIDSTGNLYIADTSNDRVVEYDRRVQGFGNYAVADHVFGQPDFTTGRPLHSSCTFGPSATNLCIPTAVAVDSSGNVFVADWGYSRVLEYNSPLVATSGSASGGRVADVIFGQDSFTAFGAHCAVQDQLGNYIYRATRDGLCAPTGVALDSAGNLYVADPLDNRVLEYDRPLANPSSPNTIPNRVFGQGGDFTASVCSGADPNSFPRPAIAATADGLCNPAGIAVDPSGNLWIADTFNERALEFANPVASAEAMR